MSTVTASVASIKRHWLRNPYGWVLCYESVDGGPDHDMVTVRRTYRGAQAGDLLLKRQEARQHYAAQRAVGFVAPTDF